MCGLFLFVNRCGSATEATATTATTVTAPVATTVSTTPTAAAMAATAAGQAVDAGAGRVRLTAGADRLAVGQVQACKLCGLQWVDVTWQFIAIVAAAVLTALATLTTTAWTTALWARTTRCGTALTIPTVVKTRVATLLLAATTVATAFTATIALAFKAGCALWAIAA